MFHGVFLAANPGRSKEKQIYGSPELPQTPRQHEAPAAWSRVGDEGQGRGVVGSGPLFHPLSKQWFLSLAGEFSQRPRRRSVLGSEVARDCGGCVVGGGGREGRLPGSWGIGREQECWRTDPCWRTKGSPVQSQFGDTEARDAFLAIK